MDLAQRLQLLIGSRYAVERELGHGGMACVYLARDLRYERPVAVKVLRPELAAALGPERFLREIAIAAQFQHPNIVPLFDSGSADGLLYYVMPYIEGESLADRLGRESQLSLAEALAVAKDVAAALAYSHRHGVVHRDIKPHNIMLTDERAVVTDFGVARALEQSSGERLSETGLAVGTQEYMSPEQAACLSELDGRSDLYSLGCVLYEMLSGDPPFTGRTPQAVLARQMQERTPSLEVVRPELPLAVFEVIERTLAKVPAERFRSAEELAQALESLHAAEPVVHRVVRWRRWLLGSVAVAAGAFTAWFGSTVIGSTRPPVNPTRMLAFPVEVSGVAGAGEDGLGVDVVTALGGILDGWGDMRWLDARDVLEPADGVDAGHLTLRSRRRLARAQRAAYFTSGRLIIGADSARLFLDLYSLDRREPLARASAVAPRRDYVLLGLEAAPPLLLALLPEDQAAAVASIRGRSSPAIQAFVQGELRYRAGQFDEAARHYEAALAEDTLFALAAFKAALAMTWIEGVAGLDAANDFVQRALAGVEHLAPRDRHMVLGLRDYLVGDADSALAHLRAARALDDRRPDAWMAIGQVYRHLIPMEPNQDSLALVTLQRAHALSPDFTPVLFYLTSRAVRDGDLTTGGRYLDQLRRTDPESAELAKVELEFRCASRSPDAIDWEAESRRDVNTVFQMARTFHIGLSHTACAEAGWRAVIDFDTTAAPDFRFSATVALQSLLAAQRRTGDLARLLDSAVVPAVRWMYLVDALAGLAVSSQADSVAAALRARLWPQRSTMLWPLAVWDAHTGRAVEAAQIRDTLERRAGSVGGTSVDTLLWHSVAAHVLLAQGDTSRAIEALRALRPRAHRPNLTWQPWLSLGYDWLVLARLLEQHGDYVGALRVATIADAPGSAANVTFLPANLELRERVARALGRVGLAEHLAARLEELGGPRR